MPMPMKKKRKTKVTKSKNKNLVMYVENCTPKAKVFADAKALNAFVKKFNKTYSPKDCAQSGSWLDVIVTDIKGSITDVDGRIGAE